MDILKVVGIALTGLMLCTFTRTINKELSLYIIIATSLIILTNILFRLNTIFSYIQGVYENITYGSELFPIMVKVLLVAYITDFTAQLCKDSGENAIGSKVELAGKVTIFYIAIPVLTSILELIDGLLT